MSGQEGSQEEIKAEFKAAIIVRREGAEAVVSGRWQVQAGGGVVLVKGKGKEAGSEEYLGERERNGWMEKGEDRRMDAWRRERRGRWMDGEGSGGRVGWVG